MNMRISSPPLRFNQRGDTIVEVLIALAIISTVLAGAFFVTNRSAQNIRDTEEHAQALQLLQAQIEQVRASATAGASDTDLPTYFCYDKDNNLVASASATTFMSECYVYMGGGNSGTPYKFVIVKSLPTGSLTNLFSATVQWDGQNGQTNNEQLLYKVQLAP
jgi:prepilin-type N-terminal cleavage/methylation domain-containing protein